MNKTEQELVDAIAVLKTVRDQLDKYFSYNNHGAGCDCELHKARAAITEYYEK